MSGWAIGIITSKITIVFSLLFVVAVIIVPSTASNAHADPWILILLITSLFKTPLDVAVDSSGNVFVADSGDNQIQEYTNTGKLLRWWGYLGTADGKFNLPVGIATDSSNGVFVAEYMNNRIQRFQLSSPCPAGATQIEPGVCFIKKWGSIGTGPGQFQNPLSIGISTPGYIFVGDGYDRIQKFDGKGKYIREWGGYGKDLGQFRLPRAIDIDSSENVFVVDTWNNRIQEFTKTGDFLRTWGSEGTGPGQFTDPVGIAVDRSTNDVYVSDSISRIQKFQLGSICPKGTTPISSGVCFVTEWGSSGRGNGQFRDPGGIAVDSSGNVFVADSGNNRIQKFTKTGAFIDKWGCLFDLPFC